MTLFRRSANLPVTNSNLGQAGEYLVAADLLARGFRVTKPINVNSPHDLHARIGRKWYTFQVKHVRRNSRTGALNSTVSVGRVKSDILAIVFLPTRQLRYMRARHDVPAALQTDLTVLYGGESFQSSSIPATTRPANCSRPSTSGSSEAKSGSSAKRASNRSQKPNLASRQDAE